MNELDPTWVGVMLGYIEQFWIFNIIMSILLVSCTAGLYLMFIYLVKKIESTPKTQKQILELENEDKKIDGEINSILFEMLQKYNPDRIMILQYHNWSHYNSGQHMKFISGTHEVVARGIASGVMQFQKIPSAIFQPANSPLMNGKNKLVYKNMNYTEGESTQSRYLIDMYKSLGFKSYYAVALKNHHWQLIGKVNCRLLSREIEYDSKTIWRMQADVMKIEWLINYKNK